MVTVVSLILEIEFYLCLNYLLQQLKKELSNLTLLNSFTKIVSSTLFDKEPFKHATKDRKKNRFVVKVMKASP